MGNIISVLENHAPIMWYDCHHMSVHIYIQTRACTRRWLSLPPLKPADFPGRLIGGRPMGPADSAARPRGLTQLKLLWAWVGNQLQPCQSTLLNATVPQQWIDTFSLVSSEVVLCISPVPFNITQIVRFCPPICWLTSVENSRNQTEKQHSVLHDHTVGTHSTHQYSTSYSHLVVCT